ncbi:MAG: DUF1360 domain-containing protein [Halobacillus sp.]|uniref:DUF1360 domain-containing protein n=1 Tax=Halobacillus sp. TaxID=56800 RepID=UPI003BAED044
MESITWLELLLLGLASFRLTRLIVDDFIMEWLRKPFFHTKVVEVKSGEKEEWEIPNGWIGEGLSCQWCVGVWSALINFLLYYYIPFGYFLVLILAIAGLQSIFYKWSEKLS